MRRLRIFGHPEASELAYLGLYAMQHRGQESAGIAAADGHRVVVSKDMGYVADIFNSARLESSPATPPSVTRAIPPPERAASPTPSRS